MFVDFGNIGEQLPFATRSRDFLIGCIFFFFFFSSAPAIHPLCDSRLIFDCQWFFETAGENNVTGKTIVAKK